MDKKVQNLLEHIDSCPLSWHNEKVIRHKDTTDFDILSWLKHLIELNKEIKDDVAILDVRSRANKFITRTM
jgi:hypothetical protein